MSALDVQEGGSHYKKCPYQPIQLIQNIDATFLEGNIIKYVTRFADKAGIEDLKKVKHYIHFMKELVYDYGKKPRPMAGKLMIVPPEIHSEVYKYKELNNLSYYQYRVIIFVLSAKYENGMKDLEDAENALNKLCEVEYGVSL